MISKLIYKLSVISIRNELDDNTIEVAEYHCGFFGSFLLVQDFINKHKFTPYSFLMVETFVLNPTHQGQAKENVNEYLLDIEGNIICKNETTHFIVNYNDIDSRDEAIFKGRDDKRIRKNDIAWFYDSENNKLCKCQVGEVPFTTKKAEKFGYLDYLDDSYLVYPLPLQKKDNHQHILSSYMLTNKFIKDLLKKFDNLLK